MNNQSTPVLSGNRRLPAGASITTALAFLAGIALPSSTRAECGGSRPLSTYIQHITDLEPVDVDITETVQADTRVLMEVKLGIRNVDSGSFANISVSLAGLEAYRAEVLDNLVSADAVAPNATLVPIVTDSIQLLVEAAEVAEIRARLLSGELFNVNGHEDWQLTGPARALDADTVALYSGSLPNLPTGTILVFSESTALLASLAPGDILVEDPTVYSLVTVGVNTGPGALLATKLPFEISSVVTVGNEVHLVGHERQLTEVVKDATFIDAWRCLYDGAVRDPADPDVENNYDDDETSSRMIQADVVRAEDKRDGRLADLEGFVALPMRFNDVAVSDYVRLTGEVFLRSSGLKFEIKIRNFQVKKALIHMDVGVESNLAIEVLQGTDTTGDPLVEKEQTIVGVPLPPVPFTIMGVPFTLQPSMALKVGASLDVPTGITIPFVSHATVGMDMGWREGDGIFYEPMREVVPLRMSDPDIRDALAAVGSAWTELDFNILVNGLAGPQFAVRAQADFTVNPLGDPWWKIEAGPDLLGRFILSFDPLGFNVIELGEVEFVTHRETIAQASGPLITLSQGHDTVSAQSAQYTTLPSGHQATAAATSAAARDAGDTVRWARSILNGSVAGGPAIAGGYNNGFIAPLPDGGAIIGGENAGATFLMRLTAQGEVLWNKASPGHLPYDGVLDADDHLILAGGVNGTSWIEKLDLEGNILWRRSINTEDTFDPSHLAATTNSVVRLLTRTDGGGDGVYHVVGKFNNVAPKSTDIFIATYAEDGTLTWLRTYELDAAQTPQGATLTSDGRIIICGSTHSDVAPPASGTPSSHTLLVNASSNGMLMAIDPDGDLLWSRVYPSRWGLDLFGVVEAPDGRLFATGSVSRPVSVDYPTLFVGSWEADGTPEHSVMIGERSEDPWFDDLADAGDTPYDTGRAIVWSQNGPIVAGVSGLGELTAGMLIGLTDGLGVRFWAAFDGVSNDSLDDIAVMDDGIMVMGTTRSLKPPGGSTRWSTILAKTPWEGLMRFSGSSGMRTVMLQPRIYRFSGTLDAMVTSSLGIETYTANQGDLPFVPNAPVPVLGSTTPPVLADTNFVSDEVEKGAPPAILTQPLSLTVVAGEPAGFSIAAAGSGTLSYLWLKDGDPIAGAADSESLALSAVTSGDAGLYSVAVTDSEGTAVSASVTLNVIPRERLLNLSTRGEVGTGDNIMIAGFVIGGVEPKRMLLRAASTGLEPLGVTGTLADPELRLLDASAVMVASNDDWMLAANAAEIADVSARVGAFPLDPASHEAVMLLVLPPGLYTAHVAGVGGTFGIALLEAYDADDTGVPARLVNLSTRLFVRTGASVGISGLVSEGSAPQRLLIRAVGPGLTSFGITTFLPDPRLSIHSGSSVVAEVDNWIDDGLIVSQSAAVGAFALTPGSNDAAIVMELPAGPYTVVVSNADLAEGLALLEVYTLP